MSPQLEPAAGTSACPWPADKVERWPIERLIPYANNLRLHSEADFDKIAAIVEWGGTIRCWPMSGQSYDERADRQRHNQSGADYGTKSLPRE